MTLAIKQHPRIVFAIDGIGALLTAALLFFLIKNITGYIGLPVSMILFLSAIAVLISLYSFCCFYFLRSNHRPFLFALIIANFIYCLITTLTIINYAAQITALGLAYFIGEIIIILILVVFEVRQLKIQYR